MIENSTLPLPLAPSLILTLSVPLSLQFSLSPSLQGFCFTDTELLLHSALSEVKRPPPFRLLYLLIFSPLSGRL
jgi:hypothetical protein